MRENDRHRIQRDLLHYRQAEAVEPDPLRRLASFLVAGSIMFAVLVIAGAIRYAVLTPPRPLPPLVIDLVELEGNDQDKDRGQQKEDPKKEEETPEPAKEQKAEEPPAPVEVANENPPGPAGDSGENAGVIAVEGDGGSPRALYGNRADKGGALGKFGGDARTESAVDHGLRWLARHQSPDGRWSRSHFDEQCKGERCDGTGLDTPPTDLDPAVTGLALLCFAAANSTHLEGEYKAQAAAGVRFLLSTQTEDGRFGNAPRNLNYYMMYNHGIVTFALAELCAMTGDPALVGPLQKAVDFIARTQQLPSGAWDYTDIRTGRYDTSVTGWQVMALKSAQAAGVEIPDYVLYRVTRFLDGVTQADGSVFYANMPPGRGRTGQGMVAVGLASNLFLGLPADSLTARSQIATLLRNPPEWGKLDDTTSFDSVYYWYYATVALFQVGGDDWDKWNRSMTAALLLHQRRGGCLDGSWDPGHSNFWGVIGGRMYTTTLNILNLQVYYRYLPLFDGGTLKTVDALIRVAQTGEKNDAVQAVRLLGKFDTLRANDFLIVLAHSDHALSTEAAFALADRSDAAAVGPLLERLRSPEEYVRYRALNKLESMINDDLVPVLISCLRDQKAVVSREANRILQRYAQVSFGFEPEAPAAEREEAIRKWKEWWEQRRNNAAPVESAEPWLVISVRPEKGLVAFDTGREGLAKKDQQYSVYRGEQYVGRITVKAVEGALAVGSVIEQITNGEFHEGDVVRPGT